MSYLHSIHLPLRVPHQQSSQSLNVCLSYALITISVLVDASILGLSRANIAFTMITTLARRRLQAFATLRKRLGAGVGNPVLTLIATLAMFVLECAKDREGG